MECLAMVLGVAPGGGFAFVAGIAELNMRRPGNVAFLFFAHLR